MDFEVLSDADGLLGFGTYFPGNWLARIWDESQVRQTIAYKELFSIVTAAHLWGSELSKRNVLFYSDNNVVVNILKDPLPGATPVALYALWCEW